MSLFSFLLLNILLFIHQAHQYFLNLFEKTFGFVDFKKISLISALILISFLSISLGLIYSFSYFLK